jgi:hypothetical protein
MPIQILLVQINPAIPQRPLHHCGIIKADQKNLPEGLPVSLNVFRASDGPENSNHAIDGVLKLLLRALGRSIRGTHQERQYNQPLELKDLYLAEVVNSPYGS